MQQKKHVSTMLLILVTIGAIIVLRSAIVGQLKHNIDADFQEDSLQAEAGCVPPSISNVSIRNLTTSGATIGWNTNKRSTSVLRLGENSQSMVWMSTKDAPAANRGVMKHSYTVSNLEASHTYYYRVRSSNGTCQKTSPTYSFSTLAGPVIIPTIPHPNHNDDPDITPPSVPGNVSVSSIGGTGFTLIWDGSVDPVVTSDTTSGVAGYEVYGPNSACSVNGSEGYCGNVQAKTGVNQYALSIVGLQENRTYTGPSGDYAGFTILAYDNAQNYSAPSPRLEISTTTGAYDACPNISGIQSTIPLNKILLNGQCVPMPAVTDAEAPSIPQNLISPSHTTTSVSLLWTASTDNVAIAGYNIYKNGSITPVNTTLITGTSYTVTGLVTSTIYTFKVQAVDTSANNSLLSIQASVTTGTTSSPVNDTQAPSKPTWLATTNITNTTATINWSASTDDTLSASQIHYDIYGPSSCNVNGTSGYCGMVTGMTSMTINGLTPNTQYNQGSGANGGFFVQAFDDSSHYSLTSARLSLTTTNTAPPPNSDITPPVAHISSPANGALITSAALAISGTASDNVAVTFVTLTLNGASVPVSGTTNWTASATLAPNSTNVITATAHDAQGNLGNNTITITRGVAPDTTPPVISAVSVGSVTTNAATITWTTNEPATSVVYYGGSTAYGQTLVTSVLTTSHTVQIPSLFQNTVYHFLVGSVDAANNSASGTDNNFTTLSAGTGTGSGGGTGTGTGTNNCPATNAQNRREMWIWNDVPQIIAAGSTTQTQFFNYIDEKVDMVYLYASASFISSNGSTLRTFLDTLWNDHCAKVQFLDGDPSWIDSGNSSAVTWANAVKNFDQSVTATGVHPYGINVDVEPYTAIQSSAGRTNYVAMYQNLKTTLAGTGLKVVGVIPRWYDDLYGLGFVQSLVNETDEIAIMDYVTNATALFADASNELALSQNAGKRVLIGVETINLNNYGGGNGTTSFWTTSCSTLNSVLTNAYNQMIGAAPTAFGGYAIHDYYQLDGSGYKNLCP